MAATIFTLSFVISLYMIISLTSAHMEMPRLLLVSLDGFRWDYLDLVKRSGRQTPNFDKLISEGVHNGKHGVKTAFVTKTFPNHYTLVTGLYEESHGIVSNNFFDPIFNESFQMNSPSALDEKWWNGTGSVAVEPIWVTNEAMTRGMMGEMARASGIYFWPGSEAKGQLPKHYEHYNASVNFTTRVDTVMEWFSNEEEPINLGLIYISEPDAKGHGFGPNSKEVMDEIVKLDEVIGHLVESLKSLHMYESLNMIITSDHGMTEITGYIYLDDYLSSDLYTPFGSSPVINILPVPGKEEMVYNSLNKAPHLLVYRKSEIPKTYNYMNNRRVMSIVITAEEGFEICTKRGTGCTVKGNHGYNNSLQSMHTLFIAHGPAFRRNYTSERCFNSVDIYPLMCHLLSIPPRLNNGSLDNIRHVLLESTRDMITIYTYVLSIGFVSVCSLVCSIGAIITYVKWKGSRAGAGAWRKKGVPNSFSMLDGQKPLLVSEEEEDVA